MTFASASGTTTSPRVATSAPPGTGEELGVVVEQVRLRFVAKDAGRLRTSIGVTAYS